MCGIAGIHRRTDKPVPRLNRLASELQLAIENRGRHASGFLAVLDNGKVQMEKAPTPASRFVRERKAIRRDARSVMLHTRFATVGAKGDPRNAHPVVSGHCAAVHNGTIWNHDELFRTFDLPRKATVDSEVIPAMIDMAGWEQAEHALALLTGGAATAIIDVRRPQEVILARLRDYPLVVFVTDDVLVWASTKDAISRAWWRTYGKLPPKRGEFQRVPEYTMLRVNGKIDTVEIRERPTEPRGRATKAKRAKRRPKGTGRRTPTQKAALGILQARLAEPRTKPLKLNTALPPQEPLWWDEDGILRESEPWQEDVVRQIMRNEGVSEHGARELVFG